SGARHGVAPRRRLGEGPSRSHHGRGNSPGDAGRHLNVPTFAYRAADRQGETIEGVMEAPDLRGAVERLQRDSYFPIRVAPQDERRSFGLSWPRRGRVTRRDVLTFMHQLGTLVEAGLPLDRAL